MTIAHRSEAGLTSPTSSEVLDQAVREYLDQDDVAYLPEQDWCEHCSLDEHAEPGMPSDVVGCRTIELDDSWGDSEATYLACGHTVAWR
ncbi:hypothetical protein L3Q67_26405 [Saccharothrix sp. AJ9571]|nr:hypothetical protein L3Q67_26405 [Saccharothrix sp. AJ9571]